MTELFIIGATGYIGGDTFYAISQAHPEYDITAMVRSTAKGALVTAQYPKVRLVYGDLDSIDLIEEEASKADIVFQWANADHLEGINAIVRGIKKSSTPTFFIHTSGAAVLLIDHWQKQIAFGSPSDKIFNDWDGIQELHDLPDAAPHKITEKAVQGSSDESSVFTAILPELARATLERGHGILVGEGKNIWSAVHVADLSDVFLKLAEAAVQGGGRATWGTDGYYFAENGEVEWGLVSRAVVKEALKNGWIAKGEDGMETITTEEEGNKVAPFGAHLLGDNSRAKAVRARKLLEWEPKNASIWEDIEGAVEYEAERLGLAKKHADRVAGKA
ncbi:NAD(P)-binding protein [Eremomyces bilateralis CBS 781.70]|uniref:NAD(P)-binding protein n=1 Tax=Eremomyces bilateralis CBS 781.70 TaxID=1392243 RepID=A0A6G1GCP3_9PEZI|nr:NAD(P)-binding protein [Eremomyces bilateralis CBS 781.70]KAF1815865.1 NAD(P)-binding protein [Eremomyces bilateralis CBS 781.70]